MNHLFTPIFIILAAICNSIMDKTKDTIQFNSSVFKSLNPLFWDDQRSDGNRVLFTKYKINAWHLSKSLMLVFLFLSIILYTLFIPILDFIMFGVIWIIIFNLMYNHVLRKI